MRGFSEKSGIYVKKLENGKFEVFLDTSLFELFLEDQDGDLNPPALAPDFRDKHTDLTQIGSDPMPLEEDQLQL